MTDTSTGQGSNLFARRMFRWAAIYGVIVLIEGRVLHWMPSRNRTAS